MLSGSSISTRKINPQDDRSRPSFSNSQIAMSKAVEDIKTINSFLRTLIVLGVLVLFGFGGFWVYSNYVQPGLEVDRLKDELATLKVDYAKQAEQLEQVTTALKLMKIDRRVAQIQVLEMGTDSETEHPYMQVEFVELDPQGNPLCQPRQFRLNGDELYVNSQVVKFDDKYVEQAEALRGTSLCVFKKIYGDLDGPAGGHALDRGGLELGSRYGTSDAMNDFEKQIWSDFWEIANAPHKMKSMGIRAIQGEAPYMRVKPGMTYRLELRSSGGVSLVAEKND